MIQKSTLLLVALLLSSCGERTRLEFKPGPGFQAQQDEAAEATPSENDSDATRAKNPIEVVDSLPECAESNDGQSYFDTTHESLYICAAGSMLPVNSYTNTNQSEPANESLVVFDPNNLIIGKIVFDNYIVFENNGIANINLNDGTFVNSLGYDSARGNKIDGKACQFLSTDCSGNCYFGDDDANVRPFANAVFYTGDRWFRSTGTESDLGLQTFESYYDTGACIATTATFDHSYEVSTPYSLPENLTFPFTGPLMIGN